MNRNRQQWLGLLLTGDVSIEGTDVPIFENEALECPIHSSTAKKTRVPERMVPPTDVGPYLMF
jgi:hypothetical protein